MLPSIGVHSHLQVEIGIFLNNGTGISFLVHSVLNLFLEGSTSVHPLGFPKHAGNLLHRHMDSILLEQCGDLAAVQRATTVFIEFGEHVIDDVISFHFGPGLEIVRVGVILSPRFEPMFI